MHDSEDARLHWLSAIPDGSDACRNGDNRKKREKKEEEEPGRWDEEKKRVGLICDIRALFGCQQAMMLRPVKAWL
jgi:hypothetical protein